MFFADKYHQNYGMSLAKMTIMSVMRHHPHILFLLRKWRVCALVLAILCICAVGISCFLRQSGKNELSRVRDMYRDHGLPYDIPSLFATIEKHNIETNEKYNSLLRDIGKDYWQGLQTNWTVHPGNDPSA